MRFELLPPLKVQRTSVVIIFADSYVSPSVNEIEVPLNKDTALRPRLLLIDNYDSFTFNLVQGLKMAGASCDVKKGDIALDELGELADYDGILLSPGPGSPVDALLCLELIPEALKRQLPLLGICLGHQCLALHFGATVQRAKQAMHGKISNIELSPNRLFANLDSPYTVARYHSLAVDWVKVPDEIEILARSDDQTLMAFTLRDSNAWGIQFHPESALSPHGQSLLNNFVAICRSNSKPHFMNFAAHAV